MDSSSRSRTVCRRRAPIFSVLSFTEQAISAMRCTASASKLRDTCSVPSSAVYCSVRDASGSVRMRSNSSIPSRSQFHPYRKPALQFRDQVRRLDRLEGPGGDEQDVVGAHHARTWW